MKAILSSMYGYWAFLLALSLVAASLIYFFFLQGSMY